MIIAVAGRLDPKFALLLRTTAGIVALRVAGAGLGLLGSLLLARYLGAYGLGILTFATAWVGALSIVATLGFNQLLVREIAICHGRADWAVVKGVVQFTTRVGLSASIGLASVASALALLLADRTADPDVLWTFLIAVIALPFGIITQFRQSTLRGLKRVTLGLLPDLAIRPALSVVLLTGGYFLLGQTLSAPQAMAISLASVVVTFLIANRLLERSLPANFVHIAPNIDGRRWIVMAGPLFLIAVIQFLNAQVDVLMLGHLAPLEEVGFYAVSKSLAGLVVFVLVATEMMLAPNIAHHYASGQKQELRRLLRRGSRIVAAVAIPVALVLILWGEWALNLYGAAYAPAMTAMQVLCAGQLINALCGPVGQLAIHTGHDKATTTVVLFAVILNVALNWLLIPHFGATGAAIATAISLTAWNTVLVIYIRSKTGLSPLAIVHSH